MATIYPTDKLIKAYEQFLKTGRLPKDITGYHSRDWFVNLGVGGDKLRDVSIGPALEKLEKRGYIEIAN